MQTLEDLKKYLEKEREDCLELKRKNDLTEEGKGMLLMINSIFEHMGWEIKNGEGKNK